MGIGTDRQTNFSTDVTNFPTDVTKHFPAYYHMPVHKRCECHSPWAGPWDFLVAAVGFPGGAWDFQLLELGVALRFQLAEFPDSSVRKYLC